MCELIRRYVLLPISMSTTSFSLFFRENTWWRIFDDVHGGKKGLKDFQCLFQVIGGEKELCVLMLRSIYVLVPKKFFE